MGNAEGEMRDERHRVSFMSRHNPLLPLSMVSTPPIPCHSHPHSSPSPSPSPPQSLSPSLYIPSHPCPQLSCLALLALLSPVSTDESRKCKSPHPKHASALSFFIHSLVSLSTASVGCPPRSPSFLTLPRPIIHNPHPRSLAPLLFCFKRFCHLETSLVSCLPHAAGSRRTCRSASESSTTRAFDLTRPATIQSRVSGASCLAP
ncbi:hypothetical protein B0J13DRAFT_303113 [Dactylonectria estremocensis]|uniref:Uncharacterized protein n=1 Tax=Dactylonectria estremocensis TaxID=1079267 RepID=A0A9P9J495_9HYPO|nr:hypothetical protein B0J13DRAFT_303113 [Dactylonectria estremocensis]